MDALVEMKAALFKAIGHPLRLAIMMFLADGERSVADIVEQIGAEASNTSRHLALLKQVGLLVDRREGLSVYYRHALPCFPELLACVNKAVKQQLESRQALLRQMG